MTRSNRFDRAARLAPHLVSALALVSLASLAGCTVEARPARYYDAPPPPAAEGEVVYEGNPPPPPPPEQEVPPPAPGPEYIWVGGYHRWNGHAYVWTGGHYGRRPHANAHWRAAHWEERGRHHVWIEGRWE